MKMKSMAAGFLLVSLLVWPNAGFAQDNTPAKKVYTIYLQGENAYFTLEDPKLVDFNGIKCLKGIHVDISGNWISGKVVYVPVEKIVSMVEFNSLSHFKEDAQKLRVQKTEK